MACPTENGAIIPVANVGNPSWHVVFLVNYHSFREPRRGTTPCHKDSLPEVPTPKRLNSLLPAFEGLTDQAVIALMPTHQCSSPSSAQCSNVQIDRICNTTTTPFYRTINGSGQLSSEVGGEEIKAVTATPGWGFDKFKPADQSVTGDTKRGMTMGVHRVADFHRQIDSKCTQGRYIDRNGELKSTKYLTSNCFNYIAPSTLRQSRTCNELDQIPSSIATELTDSISCMESPSQSTNSMNNSTTELAKEISEKPICDKYYETANSPRKDNKQTERNDHNGVVVLTSCLINKDCHERTKTQSNSTGNQIQDSYPSRGSSSKRYILITTRTKSPATSRCMASVAQVESTPLTKRSAMPSSDDKPKTEGTSPPALISPPKLLKDPINESYTSDMKQLETDNPTYHKLSKDAGFPDCLSSPDKTFLSALLSEDNKPFEEWFAAKVGDIGPFLKEFILEGSTNERQLKTTKGIQNKESKTESDKLRKHRSEVKTDRSLGDSDKVSSLSDKPEAVERLNLKLKDVEDETATRSAGSMAKPSRPIPSKLKSSSTVFDNTKNVNEHRIKENVRPVSKGSESPAELADHQYSLSISPLTLASWESDDDKSNNLHREGSGFEDREVERLAEGDVAHSGNGKGSSSSVGENVSRKDCSSFVLEKHAFGTTRSRCEGNVISVKERRQSLHVDTLTLPGPMCFTDSSVTMRKPDGILQAIAKRVDDEVNSRLTPDKSSLVNNVMQQRKGSMLYAGDANTNQNCSRGNENEIESSFDSKEVGSDHSPFDIQPQFMPVRDEQSSRKPCTRQSTDQHCKSEYRTPNSKNETEMKPDDVRGCMDDKRTSTASTRINVGEKSQDPSATSAVSDIGTKGKDAFSQSRRKHDYNLRSCNRYKNQSNKLTVQRSHKKGLESSLNEKEVSHGVVQIHGDHLYTHVQGGGQGVDGKSFYNKSSSLENRAFSKVDIVSDLPKDRPTPSSRKTAREQKRVSQPASREITLTSSHESAAEIGTENDHHPHCLVKNTCVRSESDAEIKVHLLGHSVQVVGYADTVAKEQEPSPSYLTRHFIRNLGVMPKSRTLVSTVQRKTKTKIFTEGGIEYTTAKCCGQELAGCQRLSSRRFAKGGENEEKQFSSKKMEGRKDISPPVPDKLSNKTQGLLKVKFPFISGRRTRRVSDHSQSQLKRKSKESREDVATSRSTKIASAPKPKMTMKLRLKPLRRGLQLKQSVNLLRRKKTKS